MARVNGLGLAGGNTPNEAQKNALGTRTPSKPKPHPKQTKSARPTAARSGRDNPVPGRPRLGNAGSPKPTSKTRFSVYSGQDRLGSYGQAGDAWIALNRLGREIGTFPTEREAIAAIDPSEASK
jgi:hypothetical protein